MQPTRRDIIRFDPEDWARLTHYSHTHKRRAFDFYTKRYLATSGQVYYHDWQLSAALFDVSPLGNLAAGRDLLSAVPRVLDPTEAFQSDWYAHYKKLSS